MASSYRLVVIHQSIAIMEVYRIEQQRSRQVIILRFSSQRRRVSSHRISVSRVGVRVASRQQQQRLLLRTMSHLAFQLTESCFQNVHFQHEQQHRLRGGLGRLHWGEPFKHTLQVVVLDTVGTRLLQVTLDFAPAAKRAHFCRASPLNTC